MLTGIGVIFMMFHTVDFAAVSLLIPHCPEELTELIAILLFIGAVGKSAQIGLHT